MTGTTPTVSSDYKPSSSSAVARAPGWVWVVIGLLGGAAASMAWYIAHLPLGARVTQQPTSATTVTPSPAAGASATSPLAFAPKTSPAGGAKEGLKDPLRDREPIQEAAAIKEGKGEGKVADKTATEPTPSYDFYHILQDNNGGNNPAGGMDTRRDGNQDRAKPPAVMAKLGSPDPNHRDAAHEPSRDGKMARDTGHKRDEPGKDQTKDHKPVQEASGRKPLQEPVAAHKPTPEPTGTKEGQAGHKTQEGLAKEPNREAPHREAAKAAVPEPATSAYIIQAGAFRTPQEADRLRARLALIGLESSVQIVGRGGDEVWHRVRLGPYRNFNQADTVQRRLRQEGISASLSKESHG